MVIIIYYSKLLSQVSSHYVNIVYSKLLSQVSSVHFQVYIYVNIVYSQLVASLHMVYYHGPWLSGSFKQMGIDHATLDRTCQLLLDCRPISMSAIIRLTRNSAGVTN